MYLCLVNEKFLKEFGYNVIEVFNLLLKLFTENYFIIIFSRDERKYVAIAVTAKVEFDDRPLPKFKVPSDPARGLINISDGVERREGGV